MKKTALAALLGLGAVLAGCTVPGMPAEEATETTTPVVEDVVTDEAAPAVDAAVVAPVTTDVAAPAVDVVAPATTEVVAPATTEAAAQ